MLFVYSDGAPDHRLTYVSVQISLTALYLHHDLDYLCVARAAPCHSWRNPVEWVMSLNLGLHCVGPMRKEMPTQYETAIKNCNSMAEIWIAAQVLHLLMLCQIVCLLAQCFSMTSSHDWSWYVSQYNTFFAASDADIKEFWSAVLRVDSTLEYDVSYRKAKVWGQQSLLDFNC